MAFPNKFHQNSLKKKMFAKGIRDRRNESGAKKKNNQKLKFKPMLRHRTSSYSNKL